MAAIAKVAAEQGYHGLTVEQVSRSAGVSAEVFDEHFSSKEQGLIAALDAFVDRIWLEVAGACEHEAEWPLRVKLALATVLASLAEASALARVFVVEAAAASLAVTERQIAAVESFAGLLEGGRRLYPRAATLPAVTERALIGGIASIVTEHLLAEDPQALPGLEVDLVEIVLTPFLGEEEARRVARG